MARPHAHKELERALGYRFKDLELLRRALTHSSARKSERPDADNERLEFLGDRVLGLVVAELMLEAFPEASEGELARRFNRLVQRETCAEIARELSLHDHVILADSEAAAGGRQKDGILADACEAVIGAVFLDGGFAKARKLIAARWTGRAGEVGPVIPDAKTALQEWAQGRGLHIPRYCEIDRSGPAHAPHFQTEVRIDGLPPASGSGPSKRAAEQAAALALLTREGIWEHRNA